MTYERPPLEKVIPSIAEETAEQLTPLRLIGGRFPLWNKRSNSLVEHYVERFRPRIRDDIMFARAPPASQRYVVQLRNLQRHLREMKNPSVEEAVGAMEKDVLEGVREDIDHYSHLCRTLSYCAPLDGLFHIAMTQEQRKEDGLRTLACLEGNVRGITHRYEQSDGSIDYLSSQLHNAIRVAYGRFASNEFSVDEILLFTLASGISFHRDNRTGYVPMLLDSQLEQEYASDLELLAHLYIRDLEQHLDKLTPQHHPTRAKEISTALHALSLGYGQGLSSL